MDQALQSMVQSAAGTGGPTNPNSRYYGFAVKFYTRADGAQVAYLERRIIPQPGIYTALRSYAIVGGDRLDNLSSRFLGDPLLYWMVLPDCAVSSSGSVAPLASQIIQ